jgi:hypothetical protein
MVEHKYTYTSAIIRKAMWELTWFTYGGLLLGLIVLLMIALFIAIGENPLLWMSGFIAGIAFTYFLLIVRQYLTASVKVKSYEGVEIQLGFYERSIAVNSLIMSSSLPWTSVTRLQFTRSFLFLSMVGSNQPVLVPLNIFSPDDIEFIKDQFKKNRVNKS